MHAAPRRASVLPMIVVAGLALGACGGGSDDDDGDGGGPDLPTVTQGEVQDATDVTAANERCAEYQEAKPEQVTQIRFRIKGRPSVPCIIQ